MNSIIWRKKFKFFLEKYFLPKTDKNLIDITSKKIFSKNIDTAIINLSVIPWNFRYQRPQQLATQLAKNRYPVFYIDNEFNITDNSTKPPFALNTISSNLYSVKLSSSNNYFIYQNIPSQKDQKIISDSLKNLINIAKIKNPILKIDHPFWTLIASKLELPIIYDCLDNQDNFELNSPEILKEEKELFKFANKIIVTSQVLFDKASKYRSKKDIVLIYNATDYDHFSKNIKIEAENNLSKYPQPIFGYFGAIEKWFDTDFIKKLSESTKGTIILIGKNNLNYQPLSKNILLLGEKPYQSLPQFLTQFNVCLIPFKLNSLTKAVNPVKICEYFSLGKPVIASKLPELERYKNQIYFYNANTNISDLIDKVSDENIKLKNDRQKIAQNNTWAQRADTIISVLKTL